MNDFAFTRSLALQEYTIHYFSQYYSFIELLLFSIGGLKCVADQWVLIPDVNQKRKFDFIDLVAKNVLRVQSFELHSIVFQNKMYYLVCI